MKRSLTLFSILLTILIGASAILTTIILRGYDVTRADLGSAVLPTQTNDYPVVILGDSLAAGVGASTPETGFGPLLFSEVVKKHPNASLHNFSQSGATTADVVNDQLPRLGLVSNPKLVVLIVGTNDIVQQLKPTEFEGNWQLLLHAVVMSPQQTLIFTIPKFAATPAVPDSLKKQADAQTVSYNSYITKSLAPFPSVQVLDFYTLSFNNLQPGSHLLSNDQFHPNDEGYARIRDAAVPFLK